MTAADEAAIRAIEDRFNAAWNAHEPDAIAEALTDDAQFITVNGAWTTSRAGDRKSTRLNSSHIQKSRMPSSA